jgi:hypothetical protein
LAPEVTNSSARGRDTCSRLRLCGPGTAECIDRRLDDLGDVDAVDHGRRHAMRRAAEVLGKFGHRGQPSTLERLYYYYYYYYYYY